MANEFYNPFLSRSYDKYIDFGRADEKNDFLFYFSQLPYSNILDEAAWKRLSIYYASVVPLSGNVLDLHTFRNSSYSQDHLNSVHEGVLDVFGIGMVAEELVMNPLLNFWPGRWKVLNVNDQSLRDSDIFHRVKFDCVTCTCTVIYWNDALSTVRKATKKAGTIHLAVTDRYLETKVVNFWRRNIRSMENNLQLLGDYLSTAGWADIEVVDCRVRTSDGKLFTDMNGRVRHPLPQLDGKRMDPLWIVRGTNPDFTC
ncbi:hypothetical protein P280DRAFT_537766 [Massarina eburnea CBS 473.64]|uniref:Uncharacterized protein n=1 Tax=Massarina eburnea CBS 473.64 TaxID=1395130 RepID=A0A6A6SD06_9PLEO|nr:hypothetical protein P280DRAFT_537766 [Massarina eburnea CBS 473.64]